MFTRTHTYRFPIPKEHLKYHLVGHHLKIHNKEFELLEEDQELSIIPFVEDNSPPSPLPLTHIQLQEEGNKTNLVIRSQMRAYDAGGPLLVLLFCVFFLIAAIIFLFVGKDLVVTSTLFCISVLVFLVFLIRMQLGYFNYVRKINADVKTAGDQITSDVRRKLFKHKMK